MTYTMHKLTTRRIYRGQSGFTMTDGVMLVPRAEIELLEQCPAGIRDTVAFAISKGYIQPVAHVRDEELVWDKLTS